MLTAETIDRIVHFDAGGLPVTSLYARVQAGPGQRDDLHSRISSLLDQQVSPLSRDEAVDREARLSLRGDMARIRQAVGEDRWAPGAIAFFSCHGRDMFEEVSLPRGVLDRAVVDATPYVRTLLGVLDEYARSCVVIVDRASAQIWEIYQDEMHEVAKFRDQTLRKPNYAAGLAEDRVRNRADELTKRHFRKVAQTLTDLFQADGDAFDLLIIGGHDYEVPAFTEQLPREPDLRQRIAGTFRIDPSTAPVAEIRASTDAIVRRYERDREKQLVNDVYQRVAAGGLGAAGLASCLWAGTSAAVQTLLIAEGAAAPGVACDESGWLALSGDTCPLCGQPTRPSPDIIDELAQAVIDEGGSVKHVPDDPWLAEQKTAAWLRFPLPPIPEAGLSAGGPS
jgi:peptide chain release factor subunit 1